MPLEQGGCNPPSPKYQNIHERDHYGEALRIFRVLVPVHHALLHTVQFSKFRGILIFALGVLN